MIPLINGYTLHSEQLHHEWSIELLRGIAALMVVFAHYFPLTGSEPGLLKFAFSGVDLFFVISGFVFAPYLFGKNLTLTPYLVRRFFRIYPLYIVALFTYIGLRLYQGQETDHIATHLFFLQTFESREIAFYYNPAFWSLPPEVEYYLILPLLSLVACNIWSLVLTVLLALISHLVIAYMSPVIPETIKPWSILAVHLPALLIEFFMGGIAWFIVTKSPKYYIRAAMFFVGLIFWVILADVFSSGGDVAIATHPILRGNMGLFSATAFALMICGWVGFITHPPELMRKSAVVFGNLSYGIYLFHNATPVVLREFFNITPSNHFVMLCLLCTLLAAYLLHIIVEAPLRNFGRNWASHIQH